MYTHNRCGGHIFVSQRIETYSGLTVTPKGIIVNGIGKIQISTGKGKTILTCSRCEAIVEPKEIVSDCMQCGRELPLNMLFIPTESGGKYCTNCIEEYYSDEIKVLVSNCITKLAE